MEDSKKTVVMVTGGGHCRYYRHLFVNDQPIWRSFSRAYVPILYLDRKCKSGVLGSQLKAVILIRVRTCEFVFSSLFHPNSFCDKQML